MSPAIDIHGLCYAYSGIPVLQDLTFAVERSAFFVVIGPNGSGKTTLLKTLAGLQSPSNGEILMGDRPLAQIKRGQLSRQLAYVAQTSDDDCPFTVRELVLMGRAPYLGVLGIEGQADLDIARQAIEFVGLSHLAERPVRHLSGGERQRAQIARAICQQPELILLDEPTAALDLAHQVRVMGLLADLKTKRGTTVLMISHDINLAAMYADRILLLVKGHIAACGTPAQVIDEKILCRAYDCHLKVDGSPCGSWPRVNLVKS
ncbi:ABC transporter ATP-binding protein [Desulfosarcina ovata]|uniref:Ferric citrate ABC transporter ATP-binding protein FecE n=1 Tax=Desulfosarcina ovata subsp. ovata TaxID=2752305 RepID=A0A5K8A5W0_9BACT|nr:ABC transporter ATP-binding protein [Desulfosarcina ovata]BBO87859.1 ferric citrate ABC transporter ATP-binding protein FecE [Desulfosarcina ovata subsp. ovata]